MKRQSLMALGIAVALNFAGLAQAAETKLLSFGLITDIHVSDKADQAPTITANATARYFTGGLAKIDAFTTAMNKAQVAFVAELGDFTDNPADATLTYDKRRTVALGFVDAAEAKLAQFKGPRYHVFGNHDTDQLSKADYLAHVSNTGIPAGATYYSFNHGGVHIIVLDAGFKADGNAYSGIPATAGSGYSWADANIPAEEINWLKADLKANTLPVIVLSHQYLNPAEQIDPMFDPAHAVKNAAEVRSILEQSGRVLAVFAGHYHDGDFQQVNGISYVGLQANTAYGSDINYHNQYATVDVRADGKKYQVVVAGNGLQRNYVINTVLQ
ncbi:metallophosphoesterase family protein [Uliginosibacterium gangwonense]|uniref:metallophosphoesterase family protein n=1 Tax=Uliginosibacterium gangwonense TaxID=392736 RepID=UPI0012FB7699|nr:metallophosphoesterase [Uliginosibacterium gangwonense]